MSLSKQAVAELAQSIRASRVAAVAYCKGNRSDERSFFLGALQTTVAQLVEKQRCDSTEVRAAFEYEPTAEEVRAHSERWAKWQADYEARKAAAEASHG